MVTILQGRYRDNFHSFHNFHKVFHKLFKLWRFPLLPESSYPCEKGTLSYIIKKPSAEFSRPGAGK